MAKLSFEDRKSVINTFGKTARQTALAAFAAAVLSFGCGRTGLDCDLPNHADSGAPVDAGADTAMPQDSGCVPLPPADGGTVMPQPRTNVVVATNLVGSNLFSSGYPLGGPDTDPNANPFTDGSEIPGGNLGVSEQLLYRISGATVPVFADSSIIDSDSANIYLERQALWVRGGNHYDAGVNAVVGNLDFFAYSMKFDGPGSGTSGIPVCTLSWNGNYTSCLSPPLGSGLSIDDATASHRVRVNFLGSQWVISNLSAPSGAALNNGNQLVNGGSIRLSKEAVSGILNSGESFPADNLRFRYDDFETHGNEVSAIISILDNCGNILRRDTVMPDESKTYSINGKSYIFHVYRVAPGYTGGANWIDAAIFSAELTLTDAQRLDPDAGTNPGYRVVLGWKNAGSASGSNVPGNLRTIIIYSDSIGDISSNGNDIFLPGDYIPIVQNPESWRLSYSGLNGAGNAQWVFSY